MYFNGLFGDILHDYAEPDVFVLNVFSSEKSTFHSSDNDSV